MFKFIHNLFVKKPQVIKKPKKYMTQNDYNLLNVRQKVLMHSKYDIVIYTVKVENIYTV